MAIEQLAGSARRSPEPGERSVNMAEVLKFVRRHLWLLVGVPAAAGLITWLIVAFLVPPVYEASATLVVNRPTFSSDLKPETLSVQSCQKLLESDAVVGALKEALVQRGELDPSTPLRVGTELRSQVFLSKRADQAPLVPMVEVVARQASPEKAKIIANAWAQEFLDLAARLSQVSTASMVGLVDNEYSKAQVKLHDLEASRDQELADYEKSYTATAIDWQQRLSSAKSQATDAKAANLSETRSKFRALAQGHHLDSGALRDGAGVQPVPSESDEELSQNLSRLLVLREQLAQTLPILTLERAPSDDVVWDKIVDAADSEAGASSLVSSKLETQEANPLYSELSLRAAQIEATLAALPGARRPEVGQVTEDLETLQHARQADLSNLVERNAAALAVLERKRSEALKAIQQAEDSRLGQLDRDIRRQIGLVKLLGDKYNQAAIAKAEKNIEDVRLATSAVTPHLAQPTGAGLKALLATVVTAAFALIAALIRELGMA